MDTSGPSGQAGSVPPTLLINPRSDDELTQRATELVLQGARTPVALESALRDRSPLIKVRQRGLSHESVTVWYVYREGSWIPSGTS